MNQENKSIVCLVTKNANPQIFEGLRNFYFDLIIPRGLSSIDNIRIITGPELKCKENAKAKETIEKEDFRDLNYLIHLAYKNPEKISLYLKNLGTEPYPFYFFVHNNSLSPCMVEDSQGISVVHENEKLVENLCNIFNTEFKETTKIDLRSIGGKEEILNRMNLPAIK